MPGLIGRKLGMTSIYDANGKAIPCTMIEAGPCVVTQVKTIDKDGYEAVQLGYGDRKEKNTPNALRGLNCIASSIFEYNSISASVFASGVTS